MTPAEAEQLRGELEELPTEDLESLRTELQLEALNARAERFILRGLRFLARVGQVPLEVERLDRLIRDVSVKIGNLDIASRIAGDILATRRRSVPGDTLIN